MRKHIAIATPYIWLVLVLVLLSLGETYCTVVSPRSDRTRTTVSPAPEHIVIPTTKTSIVEEWTNLDFSVRDAQVFESFVLLNNSAPPWGEGPEDGEPYVAAFDPQNQETVWKLEYAPAAPVVANSQNAFLVEDSRLVAIDLNSGDEMWSVPFTDLGLSQVLCDDDLVLAANGESLFAFNAVDGELHWKSDLPVPLDPFVPLITSFTSWREHSALAKHGHVVYARRLDYHDTDECRFSLFALDASDGSERWRFPIQQSNYGECVAGTLPLAFGDELVLVGSWDNFPENCMLNALNEDNGEVVWRYQATESCFVRSFFLNGKFILISAKSILALEARTGNLLWRQEHLLGSMQQLIAHREWGIFLAGGTAEKTLSLVDLHSGKMLDQQQVPMPENCKFASGIAGLSDDQVVLIVGNCIRLFSVSEEGHLQP
jgi:outer membrane protein assembly factor BamB